MTNHCFLSTKLLIPSRTIKNILLIILIRQPILSEIFKKELSAQMLSQSLFSQQFFMRSFQIL